MPMNPQQLEAVNHIDGPCCVTAGAGAGKTTVLTKRIENLVKHGVDPKSILSITFTKKAAEEIRSRIEGWGEKIRGEAKKLPYSEQVRTKISDINFSAVVCGTIDSIAQQALVDYRHPAEAPPQVIDEPVSLALMNKYGYMRSNIFQLRAKLEEEMNDLYGKIPKGSERNKRLLDLNCRLKENMVPLDRLDKYPCIKKCLESYNEELSNSNLVDYPLLESKFLDLVRNNAVYADSFRYIFVDEYQDTNILQEAIYKQLIKCAVAHGGSCMVVGDDDQSIYRFRGSRVNLFRNLENRMNDAGVEFETVFLSANYRSTPNIVDFFNRYIILDKGLQSARIMKPQMESKRKEYENFPILGMFRDDPDSLAKDLSDFICAILKGNGFTFEDKDHKLWTIAKGDGGAADIVLLLNSPAEYSSNNKQRLPYYLRNNLENNGITVYNPRGRDFQNTEGVDLICGLTLLCIDPQNHVSTVSREDCAYAPSDVYNKIVDWREKAEGYIRQCDIKVGGVSLQNFVSNWQSLRVLNSKGWIDASLIDLMYQLMAWIPSMYRSLDGLVYLQAVMNIANNSVFVNNSDRKIFFKLDENGKYSSDPRSVKNAIQDIFIPIASGLVNIDEELMGDEPYNRINIMSIHQAKGLEFPITIVDVASDFKINSPSQRFKRYPDPKDHDVTSSDEDLISALSPEKITRSQTDRCFDDLYRKYYVAFSRAQDVLLLVGLRRSIYGNKGKTIPNVGTGWTRDNDWAWGNGLEKLNITMI